MCKLTRLALLLLLALGCLSLASCGEKAKQAPVSPPSADAVPAKAKAKGGSDLGDMPIYPGSNQAQEAEGAPAMTVPQSKTYANAEHRAYETSDPVDKVAEYKGMRTHIEGYATPENSCIIDKLRAWANERGRTPVEPAIAWLLGKPMVSSVIAGVSKVEHVAPNARAGEWKLTAEEMAELRAILEGEEEKG